MGLARRVETGEALRTHGQGRRLGGLSLLLGALWVAVLLAGALLAGSR
jgi:hypothetical protein